MGREQDEYHASMRAAVVLGLGGFMSFMAVLIPLTGLTTFGLEDVFLAVLVGAPTGFFLGAILGAVVSSMARISSSDLVERESRGPQLAGEKCALCGKTIDSDLQDEFCRDCRAPVHFRCQPAEKDERGFGCPTCGVRFTGQTP
jgi:hypothetical protein